MDPIIGGLISGGASLLGSIFSSDTSAQNTQANIMAQEAMQQQTQQFNAQQAQMNRDFQQQMSSTAYQRGVQDMKHAGLNPAMMFGTGGPASVPGGSAASTGTPNMALSQRTSPLAGIGDAVNKAIGSAVQVKTMDKMSDEMANLNTQNEVLRKQIDAIMAGTAKTRQETKTEESRTLKEANVASLTGLELPGARVGAKEAEGVLKTLGDWGINTAGVLKYGAGGVKSVVDAVSPMSKIMQGFSALESDRLQRKINQGNFIGKYGTPIDEYLKP